MKTLADYITKALEGKSAQTIKSYHYTLIRFAKYLEQSGGSIDNLTRGDVQAYLSWMQTVHKRSAATIKRELAAITSFANYQGRPDAVSNIITPKPSKKMAPKALDRNERNLLLRRIERDRKPRDIAMAYLLYYCGLRVGELVALDRSDITVSERKGEVLVRFGKYGKERIVPIDIKARPYIAEYLESRNDDHAAAFVTTKHGVKRISIRLVQDIVSEYGIHPHLLRHTFATDLVRSGTDMATVAYLMGHSDVSTTMRYVQPTESDLHHAVGYLGL